MASNSPSTPNWRTVLAYLAPSLAYCHCGFSTASISGFQAMIGFLSTYGHLDPTTKTGWNMGVVPQQLAASFINFGTLVGILCAKPLGRYLGRRYGLWLACLVSVTGSGLQFKSSNVMGLYARRTVIGISNGLFVAFANAYTVESAPAHLKQKITSLFAVWFCAGSVLGAATNNFTQNLPGTWGFKVPLTCHITIPTLLVMLIFFIPESPRWLLFQGDMEGAKKSLATLRRSLISSDKVEKEILDITRSISSQGEPKPTNQYLAPFNSLNRRRTILCIAILLSNSASGIWLLLSYGTAFFQLSNVPSPFMASIFNNLANLLGAVLGFYLCSSMRRRTMLMVGHLGPAVCMLGLAFSYTLRPDERVTGMILLGFVIVHGFFYYSFSFVLSTQLCGEIVGPENAGVNVGIGLAINYVMAWLIAFTMPYFINTRQLNWGPRVAYIWGVSNVTTAAFFFFFLPETKGRTHEEVKQIFQKRHRDLKKDQGNELSWQA